MNAFTRILIATAPLAAVLASPALATAHPNNDTDVTVTTYSSTVQVDIFNYHPFPIDCVTSVDGGTTLTATISGQATNSTWHGGTPAGTHTVSWSCGSSDGTSHGSGSKTVTVADTSNPNSGGGKSKKFDPCDADVLGGFEKLGFCPKK